MTTPEPTSSPSSNPTSPKHKAINSKSTNRRQCKRASDDLSRSTPVRNNLSQRKQDSTEIGWLLYSTKEMDAGALADEIEDLVGVKVGLCWKIIDVGTKGKLPETQRVRALCVEVNSRFRWEAQRKLISYFGRNLKNLKEYPNGIRLRFIKNKKDAINSAEKGKIEKLRARQKSFLSYIVSSETWDIVQLDYSAQSKEPTLRQMIMSLTTSNDIPLFHCVDLDCRGEGHVFQFSPEVKVEAESTINTLLPILKHRFPDIEVDKHFTHETNDRCKGLIFDPDKGVVVDSLVNDHLTFINEKNLLDHPKLVELTILGLNIWHKNDRFPLTYEILESDLRKAWTKQRRIGWRSFIEGFWVSEWRSCQEQYLEHINSQKSSILWISRAQRRIWLIAWNMWDHSNNYLHNDESTLHVLRCRQTGAKDLWERSIQNLEIWMTNNQGHPELVELIILGLNKWYTNERLPLTYDILEPSLRQAWLKQRRLGWTSFIEGFWATDWRLCQSEYFNQLKSQKSSILWISRAQRRIWLIAWNLWEHRNQFLHNKGRTIHPFETRALNEEITKEWETGLGQPPPKYSHLFQGNIQTRLDEPINNKMMWILSVWSARDNEINIGPMQLRNNHIVNLLDRWKSKNAIED